jgi:hypothetical protein
VVAMIGVMDEATTKKPIDRKLCDKLNEEG